MNNLTCATLADYNKAAFDGALCKDRLYVIADSADYEVRPVKMQPKICSRCGAAMNSSVCEYCGVRYA